MSQARRFYSPLSNPSCIRLLNINSAATRNEPLVCTLKELDLDSHTGYSGFSALSYRWGTEQAEQPISLNGSSIYIRKNLYDFLVIAREHEWTRNFWVDSLCINQNDLEEKSQQVAKMGEIYSRAMHVLVWLGPLSREEYRALAEMEKISDLGREEKLDLNELSDPAKLGLDRLANNPYWTRKWIVQEILLAGPNASLVTGSGWQIRLVAIARFIFNAINQAERKRRSDWFQEAFKSKYAMEAKMNAGDAVALERTEFAKFASEQRERTWRDWSADTYHEMYCCRNTTGLETLAESLSIASMTHSPNKLSNLITKYSDFQCQEPLDHIFAFISLASLESIAISIDYSMDKSKLYWEFLISTGKELQEELKDIKKRRMVHTLRGQPRSLLQAMRLGHADTIRTIGQFWGEEGMTRVWEPQFVEAMRNCISTLRVTKQKHLPTGMRLLLAHLPKFEIDYAEARLLPPSPKAMKDLAEILSHITTLHESTTCASKPMEYDIGLYDYNVAVVEDTGLSIVAQLLGPSEIMESDDTTLEIYNASSVPVAFSEVNFDGHHTEIQHWIFQSYVPADKCQSPVSVYPLLTGDLLCMFTGHQPALILRRISKDVILLGVAMIHKMNSKPKHRIQKQTNRLSNHFKALYPRNAEKPVNTNLNYSVLLRPHSVLSLRNWGQDAKSADYHMHLKG